MIDNLEQIKSLLTFESEDDFYMVQIIKRKKEHPELGSNNHMVKMYYVSSVKYLEDQYGEMKCLADFHNARVMINLNRRSYEKLAFHTLKKVTDQIMNRDYRSVRKAYNTVAGQTSNERSKKWIIDIDDQHEAIVRDVLQALREDDVTVYATLPTKNGCHVITSPFRLDAYFTDSRIIVHDIHKDNPTILYVPEWSTS